MEIKYSIMPHTKEAALAVERMRYETFGVEYNSDTMEEYYINEIETGNILVFLCTLDNHPAAACYVTNLYKSLFIDFIFVLPEYQQKGLYLGRKLLQQIFDNKKLIEEYFNCSFTKSSICPADEKSRKIYEKIGYAYENGDSYMSKTLQ